MFDLNMRPHFLMLGMLSILSCQQRPDSILPPDKSAHNKFAPIDHLYLQRAYPNKSLELRELTADIIAEGQTIRRQIKKRSAGTWQLQGPGNAGARVNSVVGHPTDTSIIYVGYSSGGAYKTSDGGQNWSPIFDDFPFLAIGQITLDPSDPNTVYIGTGDPNISGNPFIGNGLYKSTDAGESWEHLGLAMTGIVSRVVPHPSDPKIIYVATMGVPYFRDRHRGVYKTVDGGQNWEQVLFLGEGTGVIDLVMAPDNPEILLASGWDRIRNYEESTTFGNGARIHKTMNGGADWNMLQHGLPLDIHSRIGLSMTPDNPNRIYAFYVDSTHEVGGVYTSSDQGNQWESIDVGPGSGLPSNVLGGFGWYFGKIRANPRNEGDVYLLGVRLYRYDDTSKQWSRGDRSSTSVVHADKHDVFFFDDMTYLLATDGGLYRTPDGGSDWIDIENIPTTQFYHTAYNPHQPALFYGGTQDNGSVRGNLDGINQWEMYFGGDGFRTIFHPTDPLVWYVETQRGGLSVTKDGGENFANGRVGVNGIDNTNWDVPVLMSSHDPDVLYYGTTRVYRNSSGADVQYEVISNHLLDQTVLLEATSNVTALGESYFDPDLLFAGTGDGNLWRSNDGDTIWEKIGVDLPDRYVTAIQPSQTIDGNVFLSLSGYKSGENIPHIFRSHDNGDSWKDISGDLISLPVNDLFILPKADDNVIFAATDAGVYFTRNAGDHWQVLGSNFPTIAVFDLEYNVERNLLVAATFGKSILSFDLEQEGLRGDGTSSAKSLGIKSIKVLPNPVEDHIQIQAEILRPNTPFTIRHISGARIMDGFIGPNQDLFVGNLAKGIYFLQMQDKKHKYIGKIIKL